MYYTKFLFLLLLTSFSFSQSNFSEKGKLSITVSSTHLIDPWDGSSIRIGIEKPINDVFFNLEIGKYINGIEDFTLKPKIEGYTINPTIKAIVVEKSNRFTEFCWF